MARVIFDGVSKVFDGDVRAVDCLDLVIEDDELLVLVGPSGCGKTTSLRMLAGLEDVSGGVIKIGDRVVNNVPTKQRNVAMVFQNYSLYPHMTVKENMAFGPKMRKISSVMIDEKVDRAAKVLDLVSVLGRLPKQLSGGQRQRVAMGRAIVREPQVFLMDEPLSNLDAKLRGQMRAEIAQLQRRLSVATLYVTHDQVEAMTLADRIAVLDGGVLQQVDEPTNVYSNPSNRFVAGFIGTPPMCFLEHQESGVALGVRPHDVILGSGSVEAFVDAVEPMGHENFVHLQVGKDRLVASVATPPSVGTRLMVEWGSPLRFDLESGHRLRSV